MGVARIALIAILLTPIISVSAKEPLIINFYGIKEGDYIKFNFDFNDNKRYDGTVHLTIVDKVGTVLYEDTFYVTVKDYQGSIFYSYYEWYVSFDKIKKGIGGLASYGTAYLTFLMPDGTKLEASDTVEIPTLSKEEIIAMYEERYLATSKEINKTLRIYPLEVTLKRIGQFTHLQYDTWGDEVTHFRVDVQVKNVGENEHSLWYYNAAVVIGSKQYDVLFESKFNSSGIKPNVIREGYLLFNIPRAELRGIGYIDVGKLFLGKESYIFNINFSTLSPVEEGKIVEKVHSGKRAVMLTLENYTNANIHKIHLHAVHDKGTEKIIIVKAKDFSRERLNEREVMLTANSTFGFGSTVKLTVIAKGDVNYFVYDDQGKTLTSGMLIGNSR